MDNKNNSTNNFIFDNSDKNNSEYIDYKNEESKFVFH